MAKTHAPMAVCIVMAQNYRKQSAKTHAPKGVFHDRRSFTLAKQVFTTDAVCSSQLPHSGSFSRRRQPTFFLCLRSQYFKIT